MTIENRTYTYGTTPWHIIREALPPRYDMSLNREDMLAVLDALALVESRNYADPEHGERAASLRTGILSTLGIEEV